MYSYEEVSEALENEKLGDALYKLKRLAATQGFKDLADWCHKELEGYNGIEDYENHNNPPYRKVTVFWVYQETGTGVPPISSPKIYTLPLIYGVAELENFTDKGAIFDYPYKTTATVPYNYTASTSLTIKPKVGADGVNKVLSHIRRKARERFHDEIGRIPKRKFSYSAPNFATLVSDVDLVRVLSNRWSEANLAFESGAYLATIILLGSILEGVLLDKVEQNQNQAIASAKCPKDKNGTPLPFEKWTLEKLIEVNHDCGWLKKEAKDFSHVVRDYRNFVHPNKERKEGISFEAPICKVVWEVVSVALS